jgi:hypothetical protein
MCDHGDTVPVKVKVLAEQSHNGRSTWKTKPIDRCIAPIVEALQQAGIDMRGSCCGHGDHNGEILLGDGRKLKIVTDIDHEQEAMRAAANLLLDAGYPGATYKRLAALIDGTACGDAT